jgi:hypothetical protein
MSRHIHQGSFIAPAAKRVYEDGRHRTDAALKNVCARAAAT